MTIDTAGFSHSSTAHLQDPDASRSRGSGVTAEERASFVLALRLPELAGELQQPRFGLVAEPVLELVAETRQPRAHERDDRAAEPLLAAFLAALLAPLLEALRVVLAGEVALVLISLDHARLQRL